MAGFIPPHLRPKKATATNQPRAAPVAPIQTQGQHNPAQGLVVTPRSQTQGASQSMLPKAPAAQAGGSTPHTPQLRNGDHRIAQSQCRQIEDSLILNVEKQTRESEEMPIRPGFGTNGQQIRLLANSIEINLEAFVLYKYKLEVASSSLGVPGGARRKKLIQQFIDDHLTRPDHNGIATDFRDTVISVERLPTVATFPLSIPGGTSPPVYNVRLTLDNEICLATMLAQLKSHHPETPDPTAFDDELGTLDLIIGYSLRKQGNVTTLGRNIFFDCETNDRQDLCGELVAFHGFLASVRPATARPVLNVQVRSYPFYKPGKLSDLMVSVMSYKISNRNPSLAQNTARWTEQQRQQLFYYFRNVEVRLKHLPGERIKSIRAFAMTGDRNNCVVRTNGAGARDVQFEQQNGETGQKRLITVWDYFRQEYPRHPISDPNIPVVNVGSDEKPTYVPAELCEVIPGQPFPCSTLDAEQKEKMIQFSVRKPQQNVASILSACQRLRGSDANAANLAAFGIDIQTNPELIEISARVLETPTLIVRDDIAAKDDAWNAKLVSTCKADKKNWTYLIIQDARRGDWDSSEFLRKNNLFKRKLERMGLKLQYKPWKEEVVLKNKNASRDVRDSITRAVEKLHARCPKLDLILVILPDEPNKSVFTMVKSLFDRRFGMLCVCMQISTWNKRLTGPVIFNEGLKINSKFGGVNFTLEGRDEQLNFISQGKTMVVGIDVTHPPEKATQPSLAAMVASMDSDLSQWPACWAKQDKANSEMVWKLEEMFTKLLNFWKDRNGQLPEKILIYRDGVSNGQFEKVRQIELPKLRRAIKSMVENGARNWKPRMSLIVVGKDHNRRFYRQGRAGPNRTFIPDSNGSIFINPEYGTVVDRGITEACLWEFYLQSHTAIQGTAKPAHYVVVHDEIFCEKFGAKAQDVLEKITLAMCYLYARCTASVGICTAAYYAHHACTRARDWYHHRYYPGSVPIPWAGAEQDHPSDLALHANIEGSMVYL